MSNSLEDSFILSSSPFSVKSGVIEKRNSKSLTKNEIPIVSGKNLMVLVLYKIRLYNWDNRTLNKESNDK